MMSARDLRRTAGFKVGAMRSRVGPALAIASLVALSGCGCRTTLCRMAENYKAALAARYLVLCSMPEADRSAELAKIGAWIGEMAHGFNEAAAACEADNSEHWRSWRDWIQKRLPPNEIVKSGTASLVNARPLFVTGETLLLNATLAKCENSKAITTMTKDGKRFLPETVGSASVQAAQLDASSSVVTLAQVVKESDTNATISSKYCVQDGTQVEFSMRGGAITATLGGSISISDLATDSLGHRTGFPTGIDLTFACEGGKVQLTLDPTHTENALGVDELGSGSLDAAVTITGSLPTDELDLTQYKTIWIHLPVALSADGQSLVIGAAQPMSGLAFVPVDPQVEWSMSSGTESTQNPLPPWSANPCLDQDNDGILDSVEREAHDINCQMKASGCSGYENYEGCL